MRLIRSAIMAVLLAVLASAAGMAAVAAGTAAVAAATTTGVTPSTAAPGSAVTFSILCGPSASSATLFGTVLGLPEHIPMTRNNPTTGEWAVTVTLPSTLLPGTYMPSLDCSNGQAGTATLVVTPSGAPVTGDGTTATATGGALTIAGVALAGLGGLVVLIWVWRSRARPRSGA